MKNKAEFECKWYNMLAGTWETRGKYVVWKTEEKLNS